MSDFSYVLLLISVSVVGFLTLAGLMEYVIFPVWDKFKERITR